MIPSGYRWILFLGVLLLGGCSGAPPLIPNEYGCVGCGAEAGNSGSGTYYPGGRVLWER